MRRFPTPTPTPTPKLRPPAAIRTALRQGALLAISSSGGKDSQAMTLKLLELGVPHSQIVIVHAALGAIEWPGTIAYIRATTFGLPLIIAKARKTFFEMVRARGMFPSPKYRQCTSDLKRGPIERELRRYLRDHPQYGGQIINAMGMRADESPGRAKRHTLTYSKRNSVAGRVWIDWLPIHHFTTDDVFSTIAAAGQEPHWAYAAGMSRLSCSFCIMSSQADLRCAAKLRPDLLDAYIALEREVDHALSPDGVKLIEKALI